MDRSKYLGGTDIAAITGYHPYKSALQVYAEKVGLSEGPDDNEPMWWGRAMEAPIAEWYESVQEKPVALLSPGFVQHPDYSHIGGNPDRTLHQPSGGDTSDLHARPHGVLEVKCVGPWQQHRWGDSYTDEVPEEYLMQCAWYMMLTDTPFCDIAAGFAMKKREIYRIMRNQKLESELLEIGLRFWRDHVKKQEPPPVLDNATESGNRALRDIFPHEARPVLPAPPDVVQIAERLRVTQETKKLAEAEEKKLQAVIKRAIGDAEGFEGAFGKIYWKTSRGSIDYKSAFEAACKSMNVQDAQMEALREAHRYADSRRFRAYWS